MANRSVLLLGAGFLWATAHATPVWAQGATEEITATSDGDPVTPPPGSSEDRAQAHLDQGAAALAAEDLDTAQGAFEAALAEDPQNLEALKALGVIAMEKGDPAAAVAPLSSLLELDPNDDEARLLLARARHRAGQSDAASIDLAYVLERHPKWDPALAVQAELSGQTSTTEAVSPWRPVGRAGVGVGYDSNVTLGPSTSDTGDDGTNPVGTADQVSGVGVPTLGAHIIGGVTHGSPARPLTALGYVSFLTALAKRDEVDGLLPSVAGVSATGRLGEPALQAVLDLRYHALFTHSFSTFREHYVGPSLAGVYRPGGPHLVRLLFGTDLVAPAAEGAQSHTALHTGLRYQAALGSLRVTADVTLRRNLGFEYGELGVAGYGEYAILEGVRLFALASMTGRSYGERDHPQTFWRAEAGARATFGSIEVQGDYGLALSDGLGRNDYARHRVGVSVRYWYP